MSNAVSQDFARRLEREGVTVAEWAFLRSLYGVGPIAPSVLAETMGMTKGAISKLADRLLAKELIERADNPDDKRAHTLSLTEAGRDKVPVLAAIADAIETDYFSVLAPGERDALRRILSILADRRGLSNIPIN
ncbi:MarR family winged helix-turn-helix transcriptional regulator [Sphingomonas bacterium]|uniref:MarR family winged helix-turn-helix transcriptional regulator n=1 Tax=Sphingomonas bacterium TaxID=1895847 RepID=UPI001C2D7FB7|nr:MarR family transcriptional regulator [Sphingomonas bacterium]